MFFFYFLLLTLKTNIFKTQSTFPGNWIVKKVATAVNGFFIHVVSKLCIFCVKLSKNQSTKQAKVQQEFFWQAAKEKDIFFRKDIWMIVYLLADKIINISKRIFGAFCWRGPPIAGGQFSFAIPISRLISAIKFRSNFRKKFSFLKIDFSYLYHIRHKISVQFR